MQAHQILMIGLIDEIGQYRYGGVGVMSGNRVVHMAPLPANRVPRLMAELMQLVGLAHKATFQKNYLNPVIKAGLIERKIPDKPEAKV